MFNHPLEAARLKQRGKTLREITYEYAQDEIAKHSGLNFTDGQWGRRGPGTRGSTSLTVSWAGGGQALGALLHRWSVGPLGARHLGLRHSGLNFTDGQWGRRGPGTRGLNFTDSQWDRRGPGTRGSTSLMVSGAVRGQAFGAQALGAQLH